MTAPDLALAETDPAGFVRAVARIAELEAQTEEELRRGDPYWSGNERSEHERRWTPTQALAEVALWRGVVERHGPGLGTFGWCDTCGKVNGSVLYPCPDLLRVVAAAKAYREGS